MKQTKNKIAISLDPYVLHRIDLSIDGYNIRSRSQAIEFFVTKGMQLIRTAVIMIKGEEQLKLLGEVKGRTVIETHVERFTKAGIRLIIILTQMTSKTEELEKATSKFEIPVKVVTSRGQGNSEALMNLRNKIKESFLLIAGNVLIDFDITQMMVFHQQNRGVATMGLMTRAEVSRYGEAIVDGTNIVKFREKPKEGKEHTVNTGYYVLSSRIFDRLKGKSLERDVFPELASRNELRGFIVRGDYVKL